MAHLVKQSAPLWLLDLGDDDKNPDGDSPGDTLQRWSSTIGIVTAIVGNVLIALALNVQRYAHTRLHRERNRARRRARAVLKRSQNGGNVNTNSNHNGGGTYGTTDAGNGHTNGYGSTLLADEDDTQETDPLAASYRSNMTQATEEDAEEEEMAKSKVASTYLQSPYWWLGQVLITLGETGNFLAYGFAPASIVSPLGVVALVSNCIIAPAMFKEQFRGRDFWGVVIAVGGVVTVVLSANQEEGKLNPHDVWDAITTLEFEIYLAVTICLIIVLMWASGRYGRRTILIDLGLVGLFGGYTALATKGVSSMLSSTLWRAFTTPVTYALVAVLLSTAIMQIRYVNKALQRFNSTQVIPIQFVLFTLCVIIGSAVLYRDFEKTTAEKAGKFVGGCLLTFFGVFLITSGRQQKDDDDDLLSDAEGVEETIGMTHHEGAVNDEAHIRGSVPQSRRSSRLAYTDSFKPQGSPDNDDYGATVRYTPTQSLSTSPDRESSPLLHHSLLTSNINPSTPLRANRTQSADSVVTVTPEPSSASVGQTYTSASADHLLQAPSTPRPGPARSQSHSRRGSTFISPSPLSSTVTTVVKDAFLRPLHDDNDELARRSSIRRIRSSIRASLFFDDDGSLVERTLAEDGIPIVIEGSRSGPLTRVRTAAAVEGAETQRGNSEERRSRSKSVSDTLGGLFDWGRRKPRDNMERGGGAQGQQNSEI